MRHDCSRPDATRLLPTRCDTTAPDPMRHDCSRPDATRLLPTRPCVGRSGDFLGYPLIYFIGDRLVTEEVVAPDWHRASRGPLMPDATRLLPTRCDTTAPDPMRHVSSRPDATRLLPTRPCVGRSGDFLGYPPIYFIGDRLVTEEVVAPTGTGPVEGRSYPMRHDCSRPDATRQLPTRCDTTAPDPMPHDCSRPDLVSGEAVTSLVTRQFILLAIGW